MGFIDLASLSCSSPGGLLGCRLEQTLEWHRARAPAATLSPTALLLQGQEPPFQALSSPSSALCIKIPYCSLLRPNASSLVQKVIFRADFLSNRLLIVFKRFHVVLYTTSWWNVNSTKTYHSFTCEKEHSFLPFHKHPVTRRVLSCHQVQHTQVGEKLKTVPSFRKADIYHSLKIKTKTQGVGLPWWRSG